MRRWLRLVAQLYPRSWRERYGAEFDAMVEGLQPAWSDVFDVLKGAVSMHTRSWSTYWKPFVGIAAAGGMMALAASFAVPGTYVSSTVIRNDSPDRTSLVWADVTSRGSLAEVIQRPTLNLYPRERNRKPLEDVIEAMRQDLQLDPGRNDGSPIRVSFSYPDRYKAQEVVKRLTAKMLDADPESAYRGPSPSPAINHEIRVLVPASLPEAPVKPDRTVFMAWGLGAGLLLGVMVSLLRWRAKWTLTVVACGLAGAAIAAALSLLVPNRYTSQSSLRVLPLRATDGGFAYLTDAEMSAWLQKKQREVISDESLAEIMQREVLNLYGHGRDENSLAAAIKSMRRDLRIEAKSHTTVSISFTYPDRFKAQRVAGAISNKLLDSAYMTTDVDLFRSHPARKPATIADCAGKVGGVYFACIESLPTIEFSAVSPPKRRGTPRELISLIDPASLPETPVAPNRTVLAIAGLLVGLFLGAYRWGTRTLPPAALGLLFAVAIGHAQTDLRFEVASIKPFKPDAANAHPQANCSATGTFVSTGVPLQAVIGWAYEIRNDFSVPDWVRMSDERYAIEAKPSAPASPAQCRVMVQNLLQDRFQLKLHRETKEMPVYTLVVAKGGPKLGAPEDGVYMQGHKVSVKGWEPWMLAASLGSITTVGRPVIDKTGLTGLFGFHLDYAYRPDDDRPDIFAAVQQQLGLKLEPSRAPVEAVAIDHLEKPSEN